MSELNLPIKKVPEGHVIVGHVSIVKLLDEEGQEYWATRSDGINDMEGLGMMVNATEMFREDLRAGRIKQDGPDE